MQNLNNTKYPISIIIINHRADENFLEALATAQLAEEVIIVDNNSGLNFDDLAQEYNFVLQQLPAPIIDFSLVRNQAVQEAKNDWIFFLDSDENFNTEDFEIEILPIIANKENDLFSHIQVKRHDHYLDQKVKFGDVSDFNQIRIFKKNSGQFANKVHEVFVPKNTNETHQSSFTLTHKPHSDFAEFFKKITKYSQMRAEEINAKYYTPKHKIILQMLLYPPFKFIYLYFIRLGFLDGLAGFIYSLNMSLHSFFVRVYLYEKLK